MASSTVVTGNGPLFSSQGRVTILAPLSEWKTEFFPGIHLSRADRELVDRLGNIGAGRIQIDELRDGIRVHTSSWIGSVRLETIEIRVLPKLAGDHVWLARLLEFTSGIEGLSRLCADASVRVVGDSLLDFVALLFADSTERVLRNGLMSGYIEHEEDLGVVRGRILADRQILQRFGQLDHIACRFDEFHQDIDENRLLLVALRAALRRVLSTGVRRRLVRLHSVLAPVCDPTGLNLRNLRREISYNRTNAHYKQAHDLAWLVLDALGIDDLLAPGSTRSFAFLLDMNLLFERFIRRLVEQLLDPRLYQVEYQVRNSSVIWDLTTDRSYSRIVPDLLVSRRGDPNSRLAIDAKYKIYDGRAIASADIYQTFLYAYALSTRRGGSKPTALLLYPIAIHQSRAKTIRLEVRSLETSQSADIVAMGIPIQAALLEIRSAEHGPVGTAIRRAILKVLDVKGHG